jgi:radical SAM superfamily enzyme YgiQ (UPF0313 family)
MVIGGLIFGLPDDDEEAVRANYQFLNDLEADASYCQMLSPFPRTPIRDYLIGEGLIANRDRYERYNGMWANVRTRHLKAEELQYAFWYYRQTALGWWTPSPFARSQGRLWTAAWMCLVKPVMKFVIDRQLRRSGWQERYRRDMERLNRMNRFADLESFLPHGKTAACGEGDTGGGPSS